MKTIVRLRIFFIYKMLQSFDYCDLCLFIHSLLLIRLQFKECLTFKFVISVTKLKKKRGNSVNMSISVFFIGNRQRVRLSWHTHRFCEKIVSFD